MGDIMAHRINVAVSMICPVTGAQSIWNNGANQHTIFLYEVIKQLPYVGNAWIVTNVQRGGIPIASPVVS